MRRAKLISIFLGVLLGMQAVAAQTAPDTGTRILNPTPDYVYKNDAQRREMDRINGRNENGMISDRPDPRSARLELPRTKPDGEPYSKEEIARLKDALNPTAADLAAHRDFLAQPGTGIFRLVPDFDCVRKNLILVDGDCKNFVLLGWRYSFGLRNYPAMMGFDIRYYKNDLISDDYLTQGIIVPLGNVPLDEVTAASDGLKFLNEFVPAAESRAAKTQFARLADGVEADGYSYSKRVRVVENMTYAVRSIAYRNKISSYFREKKGTDLTIAFRIVKKAESGEILVVWKELKNQKSPELKFGKGEAVTDLSEPMKLSERVPAFGRPKKSSK